MLAGIAAVVDVEVLALGLGVAGHGRGTAEEVDDGALHLGRAEAGGAGFLVELALAEVAGEVPEVLLQKGVRQAGFVAFGDGVDGQRLFEYGLSRLAVHGLCGLAAEGKDAGQRKQRGKFLHSALLGKEDSGRRPRRPHAARCFRRRHGSRRDACVNWGARPVRYARDMRTTPTESRTTPKVFCLESFCRKQRRPMASVP